MRMGSRLTFKRLKNKIERIEKYLGPRLYYKEGNAYELGCDKVWLVEYLAILKKDYYRRIGKRQNIDKMR